jgi:hypothetical protein
MKPGVSQSEMIGMFKGVAKRHKTRRFVAGVRIDCATEMFRIVGQQAERLTVYAHKGGDDADAKERAQF